MSMRSLGLLFDLSSIVSFLLGGRRGAMTVLARGEPRRISVMTANDTASGTYCRHDSTSPTVNVGRTVESWWKRNRRDVILRIAFG